MCLGFVWVWCCFVVSGALVVLLAAVAGCLCCSAVVAVSVAGVVPRLAVSTRSSLVQVLAGI